MRENLFSPGFRPHRDPERTRFAFVFLVLILPHLAGKIKKNVSGGLGKGDQESIRVDG